MEKVVALEHALQSRPECVKEASFLEDSRVPQLTAEVETLQAKKVRLLRLWVRVGTRVQLVMCVRQPETEAEFEVFIHCFSSGHKFGMGKHNSFR